MSDADIAQKFWSRTIKGDNEICWSWVGSQLKKDGRGVMWFNGRNTTAPRISWFLHYGFWPDPSMFVCHTCDNPSCVNPHHLWLGTNQDNIQDAASKGRLPGQKKSKCKRGHDLTGDNLRINTQGRRTCRTCQTYHRRKHAVKSRAALQGETE